jgi:hypothetical protein
VLHALPISFLIFITWTMLVASSTPLLPHPTWAQIFSPTSYSEAPSATSSCILILRHHHVCFKDSVRKTIHTENNLRNYWACSIFSFSTRIYCSLAVKYVWELKCVISNTCFNMQFK